MPLVLRIENVDTLPDGGPVFVEIDRRGIDIGRDTYLDWTLPDPERFISGKHCEIHFRDGGYWLHDVSTNGTSVNGQPGRLTEPHRLQHGDRIHIGPYIVQTELSGVEAGPGGPGPVPEKGGTSVGGDPWGDVGSTAEAIDRRDFTARSQSAAGKGPVDLAEENISWGFGDVSPSAEPAAPALDAASEWGAPPEPAASAPAAAPSDAASEWGAPATPTTPEEAAPAAATPAASSASDGLDWGAPASDDVSSGGTSPWDFSPTPAAPSEPSPPPVPETTDSPAPEPASEQSVGDNPFLAEPAKPETPQESEAKIEPKGDDGAFGALSEAAKPAVTAEQKPVEPVAEAPVKAPDPAPGLSEQWGGGGPEPAPVTEPSPTPEPVSQIEPAIAKVATVTSVAANLPAGDGAFIAAFERGAGLPEGSIAGRTDDAFAEELGQLFRGVTQSLQAMLLARAETKSAMRSSERTMIGALENNPLKFSPTPEDAMRIMFGQKSRSYLDAGQTIDQSFSDLQKHQMQTFGAMQSALQVLIGDLDPENIAGDTAKDGGLAGLVGSRRAKLWDTYVERFKAKSAHHDRGMIDAFMILFAEMYDRQG